MRYLITISSLTSGSGMSRYVFSLCRSLVGENDVWVMTTHDDGTISYEREELDAISPHIQLVSLGTKGKISKYLNVLKWINHIKPNIIVNNFNATIQYILPLINRKIKVVHVLHNDWIDFYHIGAINGNRITSWIAPTQAIATSFNSYTSNRFTKQVKVIPHGVEEFNFPKKNNNKLEIVYTGVLYEHKGVRILPAIIRSLQSKGIDVHFSIIGGGILSDWLKEQFRKEIADGSVEMTGVIPHNEVYNRMSSADIFIYPTHLDAFGLVIAEAMMCGAVPVVTHLKGITDNLITDKVDGFLIEQDNTSSFVDSIIKLNNDRVALAEMSLAAHNKAKSNFSLKKMQDNYKNYFVNLISSK